MDRSRWLVTIVFFLVAGGGGTALALLMSDGKGASWVVLGVLLALVWGALVFRMTYRWAHDEQERWRARFGKKRR
jgi:hypothetical protein